MADMYGINGRSNIPNGIQIGTNNECMKILSKVDNIDTVRVLNRMSLRICKVVKKYNNFNGSPDAFGAGCALYLYDRYGTRFLSEMLDDNEELEELVANCVGLYNCDKDFPEVMRLKEIVEFIDEHGEMFGEYLKDDEVKEVATQNNPDDTNAGLFKEDIEWLYKVTVHDLEYHNFDPLQEHALAGYVNALVDLYNGYNTTCSEIIEPGEIADLLDEMWQMKNALVEDMQFRRMFILICKQVRTVISWEKDNDREVD